MSQPKTREADAENSGDKRARTERRSRSPTPRSGASGGSGSAQIPSVSQEAPAEVAVAGGAVPDPDGVVGAINQEYQDHTFPLNDGDEAALIPPVSGGAK